VLEGGGIEMVDRGGDGEGRREEGREDEGFADAIEMPAAPVSEHTQHASYKG